MKAALRPILVAVALVTAAVATLATTPAAPTARSEVDLQVELNAEQPSVARRVRVVIDNGGNDLGSAELVVSPAGDTFDLNPALWVSLVPEDPREGVNPTQERFGTYADHGFGDLCGDGCDRTYAVVARLVDVAGPAIADELTLALFATYSGEGAAAPTGAVATLTVDPEPVQVMTVPALRATQSGVLEVGEQVALPGEESARDTWSGELSVPAEALSAAAQSGFPLAGRIIVRGQTFVTGEAVGAGLFLTVADLTGAFGELAADYPTDLQLEVDWLAACEAATDCVLPVYLEMQWFGDSAETPSGAPRSVRHEFELTAELIYLGGATPPEGARLSLTAK